MLIVQLRALTGLLTAADNESDARLVPEELEDILLEHEELYWQHIARRRSLTLQTETSRRVVGTATLCGAATEDEALATLARVPGLRGLSEPERLGVASWVADLYPAPASRYWGSLQPDRVGEHLVGRITADRPSLIADVLDGAAADQRYLALTVLTRAAGH